MGKVLNFNSGKRTVLVSVCDSTQNYQTFEAESVEVPSLSFEEHQVWWGDDKCYVAGAHSWNPATIKGPQEIADAIRFGIPPVRVTFEYKPKKDVWWELHEAYLSTKSSPETHIIHFKAAIKHE